MSEGWHLYGQWMPYKNKKGLRNAICNLNKFLQVMAGKFGKPRDLKWETKEDKISFMAQFNTGGNGKIHIEGLDYYLYSPKKIYEPITQEDFDNGREG